MNINLQGLPTAIYSNRLYKDKKDLHGKIVVSDKKLSSGHCCYPLSVTLPYEYNDYLFSVGYGKNIDYKGLNGVFTGNTIEECVNQLIEWVEENVVFDFDDATSEYHSYSYFDKKDDTQRRG